jgi:hypothetical protein
LEYRYIRFIQGTSNFLTVINFIEHILVSENLKMIIILEKDKITEHVKHKLLKKGLSLIGMSDKDLIFNKLEHQVH